MTIIKLRRGTAAQWTSANTILASGEPGYETDTSKYKLGDGVTAWNALPYFLDEIELSNTYASRTSRAKHAPAFGLYFPEAEGAVGNGTTDDAAALTTAATTAAAAGGQVALKANTTYALGSTFTIPAGTRLVGNKATLKLVTSSARVATLASNTQVGDVIFDGNNLATSYVVETSLNADTITLNRCRITSSGGTGTIGLRTLDGLKNLSVVSCTFDNLNNCVKIDKNPDTVRIVDCVFTAWEDRAIWAVSSAGFASSNVWIEGNLIRPHRVRTPIVLDGSGVPTQVRQPIAFQGVDTDLHRNVNIVRNVVIGGNAAYKDASAVGSADLISVHRTNGLKVIGNTVEYGGDVGITIAQQSTHIIVADNVCRFNNSTGICIGSAGSISTSDFAVTGNVCMNNGQDRGGNIAAAGNNWSRNGINLNICQRGTIVGNRCGDDQATQTQQYGITTQNTTDVQIGTNQTTGNAISGLHKEGAANVRLTVDLPPVRAVKAADQTVNNSVTLVNVTDLTVPVSAEGIYLVEGYLIYNASTTADLALKWSVPSGASMDWTTDAPSSTTTSANTVIQRTAWTVSSTATIGGTGANTVATPYGVLTVGATSGNTVLQMAQGTAEVSDAILRGGSWIRLTRVG